MEGVAFELSFKRQIEFWWDLEKEEVQRYWGNSKSCVTERSRGTVHSEDGEWAVFPISVLFTPEIMCFPSNFCFLVRKIGSELTSMPIFLYFSYAGHRHRMAWWAVYRSMPGIQTQESWDTKVEGVNLTTMPPDWPLPLTFWPQIWQGFRWVEMLSMAGRELTMEKSWRGSGGISATTVHALHSKHVIGGAVEQKGGLSNPPRLQTFFKRKRSRPQRPPSRTHRGPQTPVWETLTCHMKMLSNCEFFTAKSLVFR